MCASSMPGMEGHDPPEDDRTFKVSFTSDGLSALRERVMDKLKEYMGDYTDDTLVVRFSLDSFVSPLHGI